MPTDLTREEIERLPGVLAEMESRLHFGGDPEDDRPATEVWSELWFCDADYMLVFSAARSALSEPTRLAAARAEGYREGVEAAARCVEGGRFLHDDAPTARFAREAAKAIRALLQGQGGGDA